MLQSMTGFGRQQGNIASFGKICIELRSSNHKFLDIVFHLPDGLLSLEDRLKKEIETYIKRGRVTCVINIIGGQSAGVFIDKLLLEKYILAFKDVQRKFNIKDEVTLDTIMHMPGILSLTENRLPAANIWPRLKILFNQARDDLIKMRQKEGRALCIYLKNHTQAIKGNLGIINTKFKAVIKDKISKIAIEEERVSFLKETDITEEMERLTFHIRNFKNKLFKSGPMGKELDFIAQEMQREANTIGAKSCNVVISARVVQIKSQIEKIREQIQNIE